MFVLVEVPDASPGTVSSGVLIGKLLVVEVTRPEEPHPLASSATSASADAPAARAPARRDAWLRLINGPANMAASSVAAVNSS
jgi:hypothetical protein